MPKIVCPNCKAEYEVHLKIMGKSVRCKQCRSSFKAIVLRSQRHKDKKYNPLIILFSLLGLGLFIIIAMIVQSSLQDRKPTAVHGGEGGIEEDFSKASGAGEMEEGKTTGPVRTARELFVLEFLQAASDDDLDAIQRMFNYPLYHRMNKGADDPHWDDLADLDKILKKQEYTERLTDDSVKGGGFLRKAKGVYTKEIAWDGKEGEVEVGLKNMNNGREQERNYKIRQLAGRLLIFDYRVGEEHGGDLVPTGAKPGTLDQKYKRRVSPIGEIREVAGTPDTDQTEAAEIKMLIEDLQGGNRRRSRDARERLLDFGKKAIPGLLNGLVGLEMSREDDVARANKCISLLRTLTGRNFRFTPGFADESELGSLAADLTQSIGRWFGWWERNKDTWTGREEIEATDDWDE